MYLHVHLTLCFPALSHTVATSGVNSSDHDVTPPTPWRHVGPYLPMLIDFLVAVITDALGLLGGGDGGGLAGALVTEDQPAVPAVVLQPTHASHV